VLISIKAYEGLMRIHDQMKFGTQRTVDETVNQHVDAFQRVRRDPLGEAFLALLERDQMRLLRLCAALEKIADGLPGAGRCHKTARVLAFLDKAFARHVFLNEKCLFPLIRSLEEKKERVDPVLRQLEFEHAADHGLIVEIASAFMGPCASHVQSEAQGLGYLLRAFFENYRRHCVWEREVLYPIARKLLVSGTVRGQHDAMLRVSMGLNDLDGALAAEAC
jgi:iron-sulfur cluster repair protein YtfE (RIC family)